MSLAIEVDDVVKVNISGTWHDVNRYKDGRSSFALDSYEFLNGSLLLHGGGEGGICATGFTFFDADTNLKISGPLTSITAVMYNEPVEELRGHTPNIQRYHAYRNYEAEKRLQNGEGF
tara:strand:+ start:700 stop:1053 length:354 start_codon:yes stop_codon:yes gene_type:complete